MGCGASLAKEATAEQKATLCAVTGKEMMHLSMHLALENCDEIKVPAPPEVARLRDDVASFRQGAIDAKQQITDAGSAAVPKVDDSTKQGMFGGMLAKGAEMAGKAAEVVAGGAAAATEAALNEMASQLEKVVNAVEDPFMKVGKDIVAEKKDKIKNVFQLHIGNLTLASSALSLVRGDEPHGPEEYAKVPGDALTDFLCRKSAKNLVAQLMPVCEEAIKQHTVTKTWDKVIENYNSLSGKIATIDFAKKHDLTLKPIELDINNYIVSQCVEQIALLMAKEEAKIRAKPDLCENSQNCGLHKVKDSSLFVTVFDGSQLTDRLYNRWSNEQNK